MFSPSNKESDLALGIDVGGSSVKLGIVSADGQLLGDDVVYSPQQGSPESFFEPVLRSAKQLIQEAREKGLRVASVGCGVPGTFEEGAEVSMVCNVSCLEEFDVRAYLVRQLALPVFVDNDACLAALGEVKVTECCDRRVLFVTVGSGIGVVFVVAGKIARIAHGATGCAGHLLVNPMSDVRCPLGCKGCLETVASARGIVYAAERAVDDHPESALAQLSRSTPLNTKSIVDLAAEGDALAHEIITQAGFWFGVGLASWATIYGPDIVLIGGAVAKSGDDWLSAAGIAMRKLGVPKFTEKLAIRTAVLGNHAGTIGAALASRLCEASFNF